MGTYTIKKPVLTEKSMLIAQKKRGFTFLVELSATKGQIAEAIEKAFDVNVIDVHTVITTGKVKRRGAKRVSVALPKKKKAIVRLKEGQSIALFDVQK